MTGLRRFGLILKGIPRHKKGNDMSKRTDDKRRRVRKKRGYYKFVEMRVRIFVSIHNTNKEN